jgi:hypothetical protein
MRTKADVRRPLWIYGFTPSKTIRESHELAQSGSGIDLLKDFSEVAREKAFLTFLTALLPTSCVTAATPQAWCGRPAYPRSQNLR